MAPVSTGRASDPAHHVATGKPLRHPAAAGEGKAAAPAAMSVPIAKSFYDLSATSLQGEKVDFNVFRGRVVLIENVLNQLQARYPRRLVVLGFPCNQFGFQENGTNEEILSILKHVRPGGGFEPNFTLFQKCQVNGTDTHPVFAYLKLHLPTPADEASTLMSEPRFLSWSPVRRSDISWNFEKFLVGPEGEPFRRYSPRMATGGGWMGAESWSRRGAAGCWQ
uniref:glutathione peroxidase n=1 Tax=Strigops habroptila TaxID=2489341 RepID=A0A672V1Q5_STRHB